MHPLVRSRPYDRAVHDTGAFDCTTDDLNRWITHHAPIAEAMGTAKTYAWTTAGSVVGYYALAAHTVVRAETPKSPSRNCPDPIPAFLIGKLALDRTLHRQGLGSALLLDALARITGADNPIGARLVVIDAIDDNALKFYDRHGFRPLVNNPMARVMKLTDATASVAAALSRSGLLERSTEQ